MKRTLWLMIALFSILGTAEAQNSKDKIKTALLIVDIQEFYFPGEGPGLFNVEETSLKAKELLQIFRENDQLVVHVRHKAKKGFEIHKNVKPLQDEKVITKTSVNSFQKTELLDYLKNQNIERLVVIGMQTHMCLEAAVRAAHDYGFECLVVQDACTTRDVKFGDSTVKATEVHTSTLSTLNDGGYGKIIDLDDFRNNLEKYLWKKL